jgi:hypothetical protein
LEELVLVPSPGKPGAFHVAIVRASFKASGRWGCNAMVVMLRSLHRKRSWQWVPVVSMMPKMMVAYR